MFKIGDFSKLSHTSIRMLRHYDTIGLLKPISVDTFTGFRYYNASQLQIVNRIRKLRSLGFSLSIIQEVIESDDVAFLEKHLLMRQLELDQDAQKIRTQIKLLESVQNIIKEDTHIMKYNIELATIPTRNVISVRKVIPNFMSEGELWSTLYKFAAQNGIAFANDAYATAIYHDTEYKETDVDVEVQMSTTTLFEGNDSIKSFVAPATQVASVTFNGSYEQMSDIINAIASWIDDNDYTICGPMFNIYHVSPGQDSNPENWVTQACIPVSK